MLRSSKFIFLLVGCSSFIAVWVLISLVVLTLTTSEEETATPTFAGVDALRLPTSTTVGLEAANALLLTPTPDYLTLKTDLATLEGVSEVRVVDIRPLQNGWVAFLEIDTLDGYETQSLAEQVRDMTFLVTGETNVQFSVILWDRQASAINFTWDTPSQTWLTTTLANPPG